ncbi:MAG: thiamine diphosphokinase [Hungatella sp.]
MKNYLIVTGGIIDLDFAGSFLKKHTFDTVIAVDAGLEAVQKLGLMPTVIVGDFDTVKPSVLLKYQQLPDVIWEIHKPEKDATDTELAVHTAIRMGAASITILGATGGRIDHMLGNIHLLDCALQRNIPAFILDAHNKIYLLKEGKTFHRADTFGTYISFLPLTEAITGITLTGFKYPLTEKNITIGQEAGLCISNELLGDLAQITFHSGILICIESCD